MIDEIVQVTEVKVLNDQGKTALVEWIEDGAAKRGFIPSKELSKSPQLLIENKILKAATPYGIPWAKVVKLQATPEGIELALHRAGIWTVEDLRTNPMPALGAIQAAYWLDMHILLMAAQKYEKGE